MLCFNFITSKLKITIKNQDNRLNIFLLIICTVLALINTIILKKIDLGNLNLIFNGYLNDFLAAILILAYINICISFVNFKIKSLKFLMIIILIISFFWEYFAIYIKPNSVFDYLDILAYLIGCIVYWIIINMILRKNLFINILKLLGSEL